MRSSARARFDYNGSAPRKNNLVVPSVPAITGAFLVKTLTVVILSISALFASPLVSAGGKGHSPLARLTIAAPEATYKKKSIRNGVVTFEYRNRYGVLGTTQWPLILRFESHTALGFAASATADERKREALILRDPDDCYNLASLVADFGLAAFDPACAGLPEDETWIEVQTEKFDTFEFEDNVQTGNDVIRARLVADDYVEGMLLDTPYLALKGGQITAVGPRVGARQGGDGQQAILDGYGYGADDDLASLVLLADIGGARVFDADFKHTPGVIRNLAGFVNTVSDELLDGRRQTAITASIHPLAGLFEPIAVFDFSVTDPAYDGADYLRRVDSSPLAALELFSEIPVQTDPPVEANQFYDELLAGYYPAEFTVRAVVVAGQAPDYVHDLDGNGKFTANDVRKAGYRLVTNEVSINLVVTHENLLVESLEIKCLPRTVLFDDLDGDGADGEPFKCSGKSGSSRSRRVPR
jgi:hypothetical protein